MFVYYLNFLKRQPYHSFDEIFRTVIWILKYYNIKLFRRINRDYLFVDNRHPYAVDELVDKDMVPDEQGGFHGTGRNFESLDNKSTDKKGKKYGYDYGLAIFANKAFLPDSVGRGLDCFFQFSLLQVRIFGIVIYYNYVLAYFQSGDVKLSLSGVNVNNRGSRRYVFVIFESGKPRRPGYRLA